MLTHNWATAEGSLQESLAKAWFAWPRLERAGTVRTQGAGDDVRLLVATAIWRQELPSDELPEGLLAHDMSDRTRTSVTRCGVPRPVPR